MTTPGTVRVGLVADLIEERWPSMDLVADMLSRHLREPDLDVELLRPSFAPAPARGLRASIHRYRHRYWDYPRWLRARANAHHVFHVVDHSYAHVVHALPAHRTVVTCHDLDAFLPILERRPRETRLPTMMIRRLLSGLQKAGHVACVSATTRDEILHHKLVPAGRLSVVPNGTREAMSSEADAAVDQHLATRIGARDADVIELLHVGSCIARKRIDLLLQIVASLRKVEPRVRLLKAGGQFTAEQRRQIDTLGLAPAITEVPFVEAAELASLYRRADVVLQTSEREGFGLPVIEALACGTPVVASDISVFHEVGGNAVTFCALDDIDAWQLATLGVLGRNDTARHSSREAGLAQAAQFDWTLNAQAMARIYRRLAAASPIA